MGDSSWSLTAKLCYFCKAVPASVFCRADSAFLCVPCDGRVHAANKLASRHPRVWLCEVCELAPAAFTCKADAAALCIACDRDIHSANSLAIRHERIPVVPFYDSAHDEEEAEAASWLLPDPEYRSTEYLVFNNIDHPYLDLIAGEQKADVIDEKHSSDGVVPVQPKREFESLQYEYPGGMPLMYSFDTISHSVSSSSIDVPDQGDVSKSEGREARVLRYREKRKKRKFEKTIRYASRKAYAETRPRIKGRFAKRSDSLIASDGVVPIF